MAKQNQSIDLCIVEWNDIWKNKFIFRWAQDALCQILVAVAVNKHLLSHLNIYSGEVRDSTINAIFRFPNCLQD
eukprot:snap_masked-scaffold_13-processed-gene-10.30-mRNA-1 protein AED:1.00 eAED:1.00 QI:0/0/0/0/1/1/2/0/73